VRLLYGDPDELGRLADRLRSGAAAVRSRAEDLVRRAATAQWASGAAQAYRDELARKRGDAQLNDLGTNLHAIHRRAAPGGSRRRRADHARRPHQGGIVAAQMAGDLAGGEYNVTHVVTTGSPVGRIDVPDSVQVLSLENEHDIVAHLDAAGNPDRSNRVTRG
jgi:hypothetical protein